MNFYVKVLINCLNFRAKVNQKSQNFFQFDRFLTVRENLARSYKFENCWGSYDFAQVPIYYEQFNYFMNSQNIGKIHKILENFTKHWNYSQNIGKINKILE